MKRLLITVCMLAIIGLLLVPTAFANPLNFQTVTITNVGGNLIATPAGPFAFTPHPLDALVFQNNSGAAITVTNTLGPGTTPKGTLNIANGQSGQVEFSCPQDATTNQPWVFEVTGGANPVTVSATVTCRRVPALTPLGLALLVLLLVASSAWILWRRKANATT